MKNAERMKDTRAVETHEDEREGPLDVAGASADRASGTVGPPVAVDLGSLDRHGVAVVHQDYDFLQIPQVRRYLLQVSDVNDTLGMGVQVRRLFLEAESGDGAERAVGTT